MYRGLPNYRALGVNSENGFFPKYFLRLINAHGRICENTKIHIIELVYLLLSKNYKLEGVPVQAELVDVVIF